MWYMYLLLYDRGVRSQIMPCRFENLISGAGNVFPGKPDSAKCIWEAITQGFKVVDDGCSTSYIKCKQLYGSEISKMD